MIKSKTPEIDKLYEEVLDYRTTKDFNSLIDFVAKFRYVAPYNAMLIHIQKPGSEFVATAYDWSKQFHRTIKAGARPLLILKPFGPVDFVFEYNDTEGAPLPDELVRPFKSDSPISKEMQNQLISGVSYDGIDVCWQSYGTSLAGKIQFSEQDRILQFKYGRKQYALRSNYYIILNNNLPIPEQFITMLHELGHFYCGHINCNNMKWLPNRTHIETEEEEFEAETACWLVCSRLGIQNASAKYLADYLKNNEFIPNVSIDAILRAAGMIETILSGTVKPRKELILKEEELR